MTLIRIFISLGSLVVLLLASALVVPYFVDWNAYRADFEREASLIVGRDVRVEGETSARLLPFPSVTFNNVTIAGDDPSAPAMTADTFSMDAELAPLINGSLHIFDMRLERPRFHLDVAQDGAIDWMLRPATPVSPSLISVEKLTITDGEATVRHAASATTHTLSNVNAQVSARALNGPWRIDGRALVDGQAFIIGASTSAVTQQETMRLQLDLRPSGYPWLVQTDGAVTVEDGRPRYAGTFRVNGGAVPRREGKPAGPSPYRFSGPFTLDAQALATEDFRFETGAVDAPYTANGTARLDFGREPSFEISSNAAQFQLAEASADQPVDKNAVRQRLRAMISGLAALPVPTIAGKIDINLPAIIIGDTAIRDVRFLANPQGADWRIETLQADFPGRTRLEVSGNLVARNDAPRFSGHAVLAIPQPASFVEWATGEAKPQARALRSAGFEADVMLSTDTLTFSNAEIVAGGSSLTGQIEVAAPGQEAQSLTLDLHSANLDVEQGMALTTLLTANSGSTRWGNADLKLRADTITGFGLQAGNADIAARLQGEGLDIDRLQIGDFEGAALAATGKFETWVRKPSGEIDMTVTALDLTPAIDAVVRQFPDASYVQQLRSRGDSYPGLFADARLDLVGSLVTNGEQANGSSVALSGRANLGGSDLTLTGSAGGNLADLAAATLSLNLSARNPDGERILALAGLPVLPLDLIGDGELTLNTTGQLQKGMDAALDVVFDDLTYRFAGAITRQNEAFALRGRSELRSADLSPYLVTAGIAVPGASLTLPMEFTGGTQATFGALAFFDVIGMVAENDFSGSVNFDLTPSRPLMTGAVRVETLDLGWLGALAWGDDAVLSFLSADSAGGAGGTVALSTTSPWDMRIDTVAQTMTAGPLNLRDAKFRADVDAGQLAISAFEAKSGDGTVTGSATLSNEQGTGGLQAQIALGQIDLTPLLPWEAVTGAGSASFSLTGTGASVDAILASLSGSGSIDLARLGIQGLNPNGLSDVMRVADATSQTQFSDMQFAEPLILRDANMAFGRGQASFTISEGALRVPAIALDGNAASLAGAIGIDLGQGDLTGTVALRYNNVAMPEGTTSPAIDLGLTGTVSEPQATLLGGELAQFLTLRAVEREEARVAEMQAMLLEKQRLRREASLFREQRAEREEAARAAEQHVPDAGAEPETDLAPAQPTIDGSSIERLLEELQSSE